MNNFSGRWSKTPRTPRTPQSVFSVARGSRNGDITNFPNSACLVAIIEGRGSARGEVGIASICLNDPVLVVCQLSDTTTYVRTLAKLAYFNPGEILVPQESGYGFDGASKLYQDVAENFSQASVTKTQRKYFNEVKGMEAVKRLCAPEYLSVELQLLHKFYGLAAACALVRYVEQDQNVFYAPSSIRVTFQASAHSTMIDVETAKHVELLVSSLNPKSGNSLFGFLNRCVTPGGVKYLRANLFQPPVQQDIIEQRLEAVAELLEKPGIFHSLQAILGRFCDIDQLLSLCVVVPRVETVATYEQRMNNIIGLRHAVDLVEPLRAALAGAECRLLTNVFDSLGDERYESILQKVAAVIHDSARVLKGSASMKLQRCFAVKSGINGMLDVARRTYCEIVDDIETKVANLAEDHGLPLTLGYTAARGYHFQLHTSGGKGGSGGARMVPTVVSIRDLPRTFLQAVQSKNVITFTTEEMIQADQRGQDALREISVMSDEIVRELLREIREAIGCLYRMSEIVSSIDVLVSLAEVSQLGGFVRPSFGEAMVVTGGRHPILEHMGAVNVVPNDTYATIESTFHLLTGANMSGKSTYLKQLVLLQIMAQVGCFVPADFASFRIADCIFSRIGTGDSIECNASTFMLEMKETVYILSSLGQSSLVIVDELGRGTSVEEGSALCWAIAERLVSSAAFCFLATHFMLLTRLEELYPTVRNHHFLTEERTAKSGEPSGLTYTHKLAQGVGQLQQQFYGICLADTTALPKEVISRAKEIAKVLAAARKAVPEASEDYVRTINCVRLFKRLCLISQNDDLKGDELRDALNDLKRQFVEAGDDGEDTLPA